MTLTIPRTHQLSPPPRRVPGLPADAEMHPHPRVQNAVYMEYAGRLEQEKRDLFAAFFVPAMLLTVFIMLAIGKYFWTTPFMPQVVFGTDLLLFLGNALTTKPLPMRFNRQTQEIYYMRGRHLYRVPWARLEAFVHVGLMPAAVLYQLAFFFPAVSGRSAFGVFMGSGPDEELPYRYWDYYCQYMETGEIVLAPVREDQKSEQRKIGENPPFLIRAMLWALSPLDLIMTRPILALSRWSLRPTRWPQEIIDVCEGHPLLRGEGKAA